MLDANAANASGTLGVCNIQDPTYDIANDTDEPAISPSEYNRVYFGWIPAITTGNTINYVENSKSNTSVDPYNDGSVDIHNTPIYWRVLNTTANNDESTLALFMLTEYSLPNGTSWDLRGSNYSNNWYNKDTGKTDSSLRKFLQGSSCNIPLSHNITEAYTGLGLYDECFATEEQNVMLSTTKTDTINVPWMYNSFNNYIGKACNLVEEKIFLLSVSEATDSRYGFEGTRNLRYTPQHQYQARDTNRCTKSNASSINKNWWLRSGCSNVNNYVSFGHSTGCSYVNLSFCRYNIRPALNIPLSKVLFAQDASIDSTTSSPTFTTIPPSLPRTKFKYSISHRASAPVEITPADSIKQFAVSSDKTIDCAPGAKLTILDKSRSFFVDTSMLYVNPGETITLHYSGAAAQNQNSGGTEYISAIIKEVGTGKNNTGTGIYGGNGLYHARLMEVGQNTSGNVSMTIPQSITPGEYTLIVYNELDRGEYKTNYAGYDTITLNVIPSPNLTNVYMNESGNNLKLTISGIDLSHISTLLGEKLLDISGDDTTKNFQLSKNTNGITVHDHYDKSTSLYTNNIAIDKTPPIVTVTHSGGTYTITVSDNESGVWKITNGDGTKVYHDYS